MFSIDGGGARCFLFMSQHNHVIVCVMLLWIQGEEPALEVVVLVIAQITMLLLLFVLSSLIHTATKMKHNVMTVIYDKCCIL